MRSASARACTRGADGRADHARTPVRVGYILDTCMGKDPRAPEFRILDPKRDPTQNHALLRARVIPEALGSHASTTLEAVSLMTQHTRSARALAELYHPHPAITEGLQECVRMLLGTSIYKPSVFQSELRLSRIHYEDPAVD